MVQADTKDLWASWALEIMSTFGGVRGKAKGAWASPYVGASRLSARLGPGIRALWLNSHTGHGNVWSRKWTVAVRYPQP